MTGGPAYPRLQARAAPGLPVARMVNGKPAEDAAALLPRLFNLCRSAQSLAARAAFGLPPEPEWQDNLRAEIVRDHIVKLCLKWPAALNIPGVPLPEGWQTGSEEARVALFGADARMPPDVEALSDFIQANTGFARLLTAISQLFAPGVACRGPLPLAGLESLFNGEAQENSVAARHAQHPVMQHVELVWGRGPLWSALAVGYDLEAVWCGTLPAVRLHRACAIVPAARGYYGIRASVEDGQITAFSRITPTDHLLAAGGALEQSLASLWVRNGAALASVLLSILDPCFPIKLEPAPSGRALIRESVHA